MTEPLEIRHLTVQRVRRWVALLAIAAAVAGPLLVGTGVWALTTRDLSSSDRLDAWWIIGAGVTVTAVALWQALERVADADPMLALRLDDRGVWIVTGDLGADDPTAAEVPWAAVGGVEVTTAVLGPEITRSPASPRDVLRFLLLDEDAAEHDPFPDAHLAEAAALGMSPVAAAFCYVTERERPVIDGILGWIGAHQTALPIRDAREPRP